MFVDRDDVSPDFFATFGKFGKLEFISFEVEINEPDTDSIVVILEPREPARRDLIEKFEGLLRRSPLGRIETKVEDESYFN